MHDLNTINRLNNEAVTRCHPEWYAIITKDGLNVVDVEPVGTDRAEAMHRLARRTATNLVYGRTFELRPPLPPVRDQSEDRDVRAVARTEDDLLTWARQRSAAVAETVAAPEPTKDPEPVISGGGGDFGGGGASASFDSSASDCGSSSCD